MLASSFLSRGSGEGCFLPCGFWNSISCGATAELPVFLSAVNWRMFPHALIRGLLPPSSKPVRAGKPLSLWVPPSSVSSFLPSLLRSEGSCEPSIDVSHFLYYYWTLTGHGWGKEVMSFTFSFIHLCTQLLIQPMFTELWGGVRHGAWCKVT